MSKEKYWVVEQYGFPWCWSMTTDRGASQMLRVIYQRNANTLSDGGTPTFTLREVTKSEFDTLKDFGMGDWECLITEFEERLS